MNTKEKTVWLTVSVTADVTVQLAFDDDPSEEDLREAAIENFLDHPLLHDSCKVEVVEREVTEE